jgi:uncharacterized protein (DUF2461 family)
VYQDRLAAPAIAFVTSVLPALQTAVSPGIEGLARTNGSIAPINNDLRFSPNKPPYKDHLLIRLREGPAMKAAPTLSVQIASEFVEFASGIVFADTTTTADRNSDLTHPGTDGISTLLNMHFDPHEHA